MNKFKIFSNLELFENTVKLAGEERRITLEVLHYLMEIESRKIHLEKGYPSLFAFVVKELGYSDNAAYRRIEAMRCLREVPEVAEKIESGAVNLTTLAKVQTYFKAEKKEGKAVPQVAKTQLIQSLENKSTREVEKALFELRPEMVQEEKVRVISKEHTELKVVLYESLKEQLDQIKDLLSHKYPNMNYMDLIRYLAESELQKLDPALKSKKLQNEKKNISPAQKSSQGLGQIKSDKAPAIGQRKATFARKVNVKHYVWMRDRGQCTYKNHQTGQVCGTRKFLEYDHIKPFAFGEESTAENLRLLCRNHNQLRVRRM